MLADTKAASAVSSRSTSNAAATNADEATIAEPRRSGRDSKKPESIYDEAKMAIENEASSEGNDEGQGEEDDGVWELKVVSAVKQLRRSDAPGCDCDKCDGGPDRKACSKWVSDRGEVWSPCLDCQEL